MFFKRIFLPLFLLELLLLLLTSLANFLLVRFWNINLPEWVLWMFPIALSLLFVYIFLHRILRIIFPDISNDAMKLVPIGILFVLVPILTAVLFPALAKSIRYNFATVQQLKSINNLKAGESPVFLEVEDWYVDRMRVIPIRSISTPSLLSMGKHQVNILFIAPIFSKTDAYRTHAKAWLGFAYSKVFSRKELNEHLDDKFAKGSIAHFKKMNVRGFDYFEAFPRGEQYEVFKEMAQVHDYFKSGYINIYRGQDVDRDILSIYHFKYFLFLFAIVGIPGLLIIAGLISYFKPKEFDGLE